MNFNLFSLFQKNKSDLVVPDTILVKRIKSLAKNSDLKVFSNVDIYLHKQSYNIELMLFDETRGLYLFEIKKWSFDDLKNSVIEKAQNQEHASNTLAFDKTQELIKRKFNEINHTDGPKIYNYLLMENLSADEYEHLDDSFKTLLPKEKIIFSDSQTSDIFKKLESEEKVPLGERSRDGLETLLTQYSKLEEDGSFTLCSDQEIEFLNTPLNNFSNLSVNFQSGQTSLLLLKAIMEVFKKKHQKVIIIKATTLARDIAYKKLLDIIEHGIIEFDMNAIELLTPLELLNKHLHKLKKPMINELSEVDTTLLKKSFQIADLIICDNANLLNEQFINYLKNIQKGKTALFVNLSDEQLATQFALPSDEEQTKEYHFLQTYPLAKTMQLVQKLLQENSPNDILIVSNSQNQQKLKEDLEYFIEHNALDIEGGKTLLEQNLEELRLATYNDMFELSTKHIILLDLCEYNEKQIEYAFNLATNSAYILYDDSCSIIELLKEKYESSQE
ncbi:hypothetical protein [Sulfurimonas marina]|uniref:DUF2075 domain-containing protein n=1 Tax=Sulfurimonas marina TaxID=2590551 RepID=A0A7M1AT99_9BACT|nr:hypothetical protein [Sulfurimonas marina]QOP40626.1 hypothetical protein FJR03_02255 [Sulfurimonas marina]